MEYKIIYTKKWGPFVFEKWQQENSIVWMFTITRPGEAFIISYGQEMAWFFVA